MGKGTDVKQTETVGSRLGIILPIGRREHRKASTRTELVRAGRKLFSEKGIYEARIEDLAEHAGIAKGTLYLYFASKVELVQAVVDGGFEDLALGVSTAVQGRRTFNGVIGGIVQSHLDFFEANPDLMRVFHQVRGILKFHRPEWEPLRQPLERHVAHVARLLAQVPSPVRDRAARRRAMALVLFGAISGACSVRVALESGPGADRWSSLLRDGFTGLAAQLARSDEGRRPKRRGGRPE